MQLFIQRHQADVIGVLSGFDRVRLRGTLRWLATTNGMMGFLATVRVLLKDFRSYAQDLTAQIRDASAALAAAAGRPVVYLPSSTQSKEESARKIAAADHVDEGLIAVLTCVEPCWSYAVRRNRERRQLELWAGRLKCLHHYFYFLDPILGFIHLRLQTWFPFTVHVCFNGREWLARQMTAAGIGYVQRDNCFVDVADVSRAQALLDGQLHANWSAMFNALLARVHPTHRKLFDRVPLHYYWSIDESEWATDVLFRSPQRLRSLFPHWLHHGMRTFGSREVMRFLGQKLPHHAGVHGNFRGEVTTDLRHRPEGTRIKHRLNRNSIKMYDKQGSVLRVETTLNDVRDFKTYRSAEGRPATAKRWRPMRKGVADLRRRAAVGQAANRRYLEALANVADPRPLADFIAPLCRPVRWHRTRARALNPLAQPDAALLEAVSRGEFVLNGFRNRDLRRLLCRHAANSTIERRNAARVTRYLRLLRAHRLIEKVPRTHRYVLTPLGRTVTAAILTARNANTDKLLQLAA